MIYVQVVQEVEVDEELIIENNIEDWERMGPSFGWDAMEFIEWLIDTGVISVDDLGDTMYQTVTAL